jgi:hypothetical protein
MLNHSVQINVAAAIVAAIVAVVVTVVVADVTTTRATISLIAVTPAIDVAAVTAWVRVMAISWSLNAFEL